MVKKNLFVILFQAHSYRTFQGITCLMQISTCDTDYVIISFNLTRYFEPTDVNHFIQLIF
jgi:exosome complex exonuclease RRP6